MSAKYIIRFDDASEHMDYRKWDPYFELLERYHLQPIIAVIPFNKDPQMVNEHPDPKFWDRVRSWQEQGYRIAMHGFEHVYKTSKSGLMGINRRSEFAGVPIDRQTRMLEEGYKKFEDEKIKVDIFVAPAHSFDDNTLKALKRATKIRYLSDGFYLNPIRKDGFNWIPQQLWQPEIKSKGVWTSCFHPATSDNSSLAGLADFLMNQAENVVDPLSLKFAKMRFEDRALCMLMKSKFRLRSFLR